MLTPMILVLIIGKSVPYMWPYRPSYAAVVSSSRDPTAVDREMPMMILSPILVLYVIAGEGLALKGSTIIPTTSCPRGRGLLYSL